MGSIDNVKYMVCHDSILITVLSHDAPNVTRECCSFFGNTTLDSVTLDNDLITKLLY